MKLFSILKYNYLSKEDAISILTNYTKHKEQMNHIVTRFIAAIKELPAKQISEKKQGNHTAANVILSLLLNTEEDYDKLKSIMAVGEYLSQLLTESPEASEVMIPKNIISQHLLHNCISPGYITSTLSLYETMLSETEKLLSSKD